MTTELAHVTRVSRTRPKQRFNSLMGMVFRSNGLDASFQGLAANKAPGVDGIRKADYEQSLESNLENLSKRLRTLGYRPRPARRVYIPKSNGGRRPLGIPCFEDRIVQDRMSHILQSIWEPEFRDCSYGFRPKRSAHDALRRLAKVITHEPIGFVVEADIKGFFENVDHDHMIRFLEHRIGDKRFILLLHRFLKAGIMEDGAFTASDRGTPQGGLVSPVLANIYLHYALDWWFEGRFAKSCRGKAFLVRYADDFVVCFQHEDDARQFTSELPKRLAMFGLEVEPSKTQMLRFGRFARQNCHRDGLKRPKTFDFLGFTHYCGSSQTGRFVVGRTTEKRRFAKKLREVHQRLRNLRIQGGAAMVKYAQQHLRGHIQHYGVSGNIARLRQYRKEVARRLFFWLNRRSQRRSLTWARYNALLREGLLPTARTIHHLYPVPTRMT